MKTVEVSVTAEHIANGFKRDCGACPVALAITGLLPDGPCFVVYAADVIYIDHRRWRAGQAVAPLPVEAREFIRRFDRGVDVDPFTFTLQIPDEVAA